MGLSIPSALSPATSLLVTDNQCADPTVHGCWKTLEFTAFRLPIHAATLPAFKICDLEEYKGQNRHRASKQPYPEHSQSWLFLGNILYLSGYHSVVMRNGIQEGGVGVSAIWEPSFLQSAHGGGPHGANFNPYPNSVYKLPDDGDFFCGGHTSLADGRLIVAGGTKDYSAEGGPSGRNNAYIFEFSPASTGWVPIKPMRYSRFYPTCITLPDNKVIAVSGWEDSKHPVGTIERYILEENRWDTPQSTANERLLPLYPRLHLLPSGNIFYAGHGTDESINPTVNSDASPALLNTKTWKWEQIPQMPSTINRTYGSSVLLLRLKDQVKGRKERFTQVLITGGGNPADTTHPTAEICEFDAEGNPMGRHPVGSMNHPRRHHNAVILPDGKVLICGGVRVDKYTDYKYVAELFDPVTGTFTPVAPLNYGRGYHSCAVLLPDGTVAMLGSGNATQDGRPGEHRVELYTPPYWYKDRPVFTLAIDANNLPAHVSRGRLNKDFTRYTPPFSEVNYDAAVDYEQRFTVFTPQGNSIKRVVLIRPGSATHAFNSDQRYIELDFVGYPAGVRNGTFYIAQVKVHAPESPNIAPPGYYLLFLVDNSDVPSEGRWIKIGGARC
jgi:hypothetical protein